MQAAANARQKAAAGKKAAQVATTPDNTLRATTVLGRRVIDSSTALILGYVDEIYFSFETRQIVALRVRAGWKTRIKALLRGHKSRWVVPMNIVHRIGEYAVVIDREQAGIPVNPVSPTEAEKKLPSQQKPPKGAASMRALMGRRVVNDDGELLGRLADVLLHEEGPNMQGFEIVRDGLRYALGITGKPRRLSARARALGDVLLVPAHPQLTGAIPAVILPTPDAARPAQPAPEPPDTAASDWLC